jgi:hypothetical protein
MSDTTGPTLKGWRGNELTIHNTPSCGLFVMFIDEDKYNFSVIRLTKDRCKILRDELDRFINEAVEVDDD